MSALVLHASTNRNVFAPEAKSFMGEEKLRFCNQFGPDVQDHEIDCDQPYGVRQKRVLDLIAQQKEMSLLAFFCHGWPSGIQLGFDFRSIDRLVAGIAKVATPDVVIPIYGCLTADNPKLAQGGDGVASDGGFADQMRDRLCKAGLTRCRIYGHTTAGHATMNPNVVLFAGDGTAEGATDKAYVGGKWLVAPRSPQWGRWYARLHDVKDPLRFWFPLLSAEKLAQELA